VATINPYVGPKPFAKGQPLFGRTKEVAELRYLLTSERIVLLYAPSGAGKSSLVQAGLIPQLEKRFDILGPTRVNAQPPADVKNRYVWSVIDGLENSEDHADETLAEYAATRPSQRNRLIVFDQFEEILRIDPVGGGAIREFFQQAGELLRNPQIWALFVLREDYLAPLDPYVGYLPTRLQNRYRLDRLTTAMARQAVEGPTEQSTRKYGPGVVETLVSNLATVRIQTPEGNTMEKEGEYVEPLQLQVVCFDLWERMERDHPEKLIVESGDIGDVGSALKSYYDNVVSATATAAAGYSVASERAIREWFQNQLITGDGIRNQVRLEANRSSGLENAIIQRLVDNYIVRAEPHGGSIWYELAHDRLVAPVGDSNARWFEAHLSKVQKVAKLWETQNRPEGLLLLGDDLVEANQWAADNKSSLTDSEERFLGASKARQGAIRREQLLARRLRVAFRIVALFAVAAVIAGSWAYLEKGKADYQRRIAQSTAEDLDTKIITLLKIINVDQILDRGAAPGTVEYNGPEWLRLLQDRTVSRKSSNQDAFLAAGGFGKGRVIVAAHDGVLDLCDSQGGKCAKPMGEELQGFFLELVTGWLSFPRRSAQSPDARAAAPQEPATTREPNVRIALSSGHCEIVPDYYKEVGGRLKERLVAFNGYTVEVVQAPLTADRLASTDVLIIGNAWGNFADTEIEAVQQFVQNGGGLLASGLGWSWKEYLDKPFGEDACPDSGRKQGQDTEDMATYPMNRLVEPYGVRFTDKVHGGTKVYGGI
jgi:hypothetical protein